jgi:putative endonuclease
LAIVDVLHRALVRAKDVLGRRGELLAVEHLLGQGMVVLERNWRCDIGEIDVIARDGEVLVFCEVKTRTSNRFGHPLETVTAAKLERIRRLAHRYLHDKALRTTPVRIDVIGVLAPVGSCRIHHVKDVREVHDGRRGAGRVRP